MCADLLLTFLLPMQAAAQLEFGETQRALEVAVHWPTDHHETASWHATNGLPDETMAGEQYPRKQSSSSDVGSKVTGSGVRFDSLAPKVWQPAFVKSSANRVTRPLKTSFKLDCRHAQYRKMHHKAHKPSFHPIFLPSS